MFVICDFETINCKQIENCYKKPLQIVCNKVYNTTRGVRAILFFHFLIDFINETAPIFWRAVFIIYFHLTLFIVKNKAFYLIDN